MLTDPLVYKKATAITSTDSALNYAVTGPANGRSRDYTRISTDATYEYTSVLRTSSGQSGAKSSGRRISVSLSVATVVIATGELLPQTLVQTQIFYDRANPVAEVRAEAAIMQLAQLLGSTAETNVLQRLFDGEY